MLAIDVGTYLTVAFTFGDPANFHDAFADALGVALEDLGVHSKQAAIEIAAVRNLPVTRLADATLRQALRTVDFMCGVELMYHSELRRVQRNLNEFPHPLPPDFVPEAAIHRMFEVLPRTTRKVKASTS